MLFILIPIYLIIFIEYLFIRKLYYTDIHKAVWKNDLELVKSFLDSDPRICNSADVTEYGEGNTPLHYAAYQGNSSIAIELISRGANINQVNDNGFTPLFLAAQREQLKICELLIQKGADPTIYGILDTSKDVYYDDSTKPSIVEVLCPVDHIKDYPALKSIFEVIEKCNVPKKIEVKSIKLKLSNGNIYFSPPKQRDYTQLPCKEFIVNFISDDKNIVDIQLKAKLPKENQDIELKLQIDSYKKLLPLLKDNKLSYKVSAINAMGYGPESEVGYIDV